MSFFDARLPVDIERGAVGGPGFKTTVLAISSGFEKRNIDWQRVKSSWNIAYGITLKSELQTVIDTFYVMQGRANGFRFKDWTDFQIGDTLGGNTATKQSIGTGDGIATVYQIFKLYTISVASFNRPIYKPVQGTLRVFVSGIEETSAEGTDYLVNYNSGLITFQAGHIPGAFATNILTIAALPLSGETVTLGSVTYKFVTALTGAANEVLFTTAADAATNLIAAVNGAAGAGTTYGTGTIANTSVKAASGGAGIVDVSAISPFGGAAGNAVVATETLSGVGNVFSNTDGHLNGGADADVSVMTEFDVPVRFDTDNLQINMQVFTSEAIVEMPQINIVETRDIS